MLSRIIQTTSFAFLLGALLPVSVVSPRATAATASNAPPDDPVVYSYRIDAAHSAVSFKVRHLGLANVSGSFREYDVQLAVNPEDLSTLRTEALINVESIDTGIEKRDNHLRSSDFFDAENHETIRFASREVRNIDGQDFELVGDLTIRGETREVILDGQLVGTAVGPMGQPRVGFEATGTLSRKEFGLTWNNLTEAGGIIVGDEVTIVLEIQGIQS